MKRLLLVLSFFCLFNSANAQKSDTLTIDTLQIHSPTKATLLSLAVPGLGQAYNKKYWKIPVVFAIIGVPLYFAIKERNSYNDFNSAYVARVDGDSTTIDTKYAKIYENDDDLLSLIDFHRKNRDLLFVLTGVAYALNILDAAVDAHLYYFEVSDDLSARLKPSFQYSTQNRLLIPSLTLSLKFTKKNHRRAF
ncbi:MAG: hypothetical protein JKY48_05930 [Flavobacteriales bacterium]|nr:hypothetical protein [Flavobacteriales bacterium]